jgi:DNA helicase-2/ATP-dependent DNA helicase PcrA
LKLSASEAARIAWDADERCVVIPAHVWTPWYGLLGSKSGFDSIEECFGQDATRIKAIETGLSSDPAMNWRVPGLDSVSMVSFSDAHSAASIGREITILNASPTYTEIASALTSGGVNETIEFFPEHGKYHLNGHRKCDVRLHPEDTPPDGRCEVCGRPLTVGVMDRVEKLAKQPESAVTTDGGLIRGPTGRPPFRRLVPLADLLSQALNVGRATKTVGRSRTALIHEFGTEFAVLLDATSEEIGRVAGDAVASAILAMRNGEISIRPGFDGQYGQIILPRV